jgi:phosphopantetheinyl transferase
LKLYYAISDTPIGKNEQRELALRLLKIAVPVQPPIAFGEHGKPYFVSSERHDQKVMPCFNYSHCEYGAACIVGDSEAGVDIESVRAGIRKASIRPALIRRVCCDNEIELIKSDDDFIRMWVMKEAYAKYTGKGFAQGFRGIDTTALGDCVIKVGGVYIGWYCEKKLDKIRQIML